MKYLCIFVLLFMIFPAQAQEKPSAFCSALSDNGTYKGRYSAYEKLVEGKDNWVFRSKSEFKSSFFADSISKRMLKQFQDALARNGTELVILYPPTRGMMHAEAAQFPERDKAWEEYQKTIRELDEDGIHVIGMARPPAGTSFFYKRDHHWNVVGAKAAAQAIASKITLMDVYPVLAKKTFETKRLPQMNYEGTFSKVLKDVCKTTLPPEAVVPEETVPAEGATTEEDLFGDSAEPEVVLVGTSNSTPQVYANFDGALRQALSADVLNVSVAGAGVDNPMLAYLNSDHYRDKKARLIIWEVPGYYNFNALRRFLRQATPEATGVCEKPVTQVKGPLVEGEPIMKDLEGFNIAGGEYYLALTFAKPVKNDFKIKFSFPDKEDVYAMSYEERTGALDTYFVSLRNKHKVYLEDITLEGVDENTVLVAICKMPPKVKKEQPKEKT